MLDRHRHPLRRALLVPLLALLRRLLCIVEVEWVLFVFWETLKDVLMLAVTPPEMNGLAVLVGGDLLS